MSEIVGNIYKIKVYKIVNDIDDIIYIGSTKQRLTQRWNEHKNDYKRKNKRKNQIASSILFEKYGVDNCHIVLIFEYDVTNKEQQLKCERKHYDELKEFVVNKNRPFLTEEERKQYKKEESKQNYLKKKMKLNEDVIT